ncbi:hypothetical protein AB0K08_02680 [Citricoccus sp. NPDC055426]|uniref:hypothetical protein n=1 Tax=Citricoccus sp. NPDC055426 TaxID=3155536 RepID=UPI003444B0D1
MSAPTLRHLRHRRPARPRLAGPRGGPLGGLLACGLAGVLLLAGCSAAPGDTDGGDGGVPANPHGITSANPSGTAVPGDDASGASGTSGAGPASGAASREPASGEATASEARADQRAVGAAAERAASFGFTNQVSATDTAIADTRQEARLRQTNTSGTTVDPAGCKAPLTAVDWSPIQMAGADASRIDFGSESFAGTGTVEVASLEDGAAVRAHRENVERLVAECPELSMTVTDQDGQASTFDFTARASGAADEGSGQGVDSGLVWTRTPAGGGAETTAQVLIGQTAEHVVMVSFIGGAEVAGEEFTTMAEQILAAAEGSL